ncbi:MAG: transcriptional regulator [Microbacterium sp. 71-36]|uniref:LysR substrate-binding domain-containing protein n=1 Tax=unclassified Microbacterium TaxID=2609290 RepID=UPI00086B5EF4|nr:MULTISPECIES: LysR substrate-binding domain-containing protein [unclassified Microbacterium]MBN9210368.1 transcriptional regulator [Microbacterium sp.]ODT38085.1 MAG: transcriptional regulator [Microbacterium sp. SCN 71-17]OJV74576.1 MAG: transcriptional regulator [Microbacterium sp. 71-36]
MAKSGNGSRGSRGGAGRPRSGASARKPAPARKNTAVRVPRPPSPPAADLARTFTLGAVPGATPGKWIGVWRDRMPHVTLDLREIAVSTQRSALDAVDAALVRLPIDGADDLHVIPLYDELPVVVMSTESALTAADEEITAADLAGEVVIVPADDVLGARIADAVAPTFAPPADTAEAIATVAAGVGVVIVPMSLARANQRRDVEYRVLADGPVSTVALAWRRDATTEDVETFVGIVRGRTARSSR